MSRDERWTPVQDGDIYCSPACGFKCTLQAYSAAVRACADLCATMGAGWEPRVWENAGWHYEARKGNSHVSYTKHDGTYNAWLQPATHVGSTCAQFIVHGEKTPLAALDKALAKCQDHIDVCLAEMKTVTT